MAPNPRELPEVVSSRENELFVLDSYQLRTESWKTWRDQIEYLDAIQRGEWTVQRPDGAVVARKPLIENMLHSAIEDIGRQAGEQTPSVRVEAATEAGQVRAGTREQVLLYGWQMSNVPALLPSFYMHLAATGLVGLRVMPDFRMAPEKRFPRYCVIDPRGILPPPGWQFGQEPEDVITSKVVKFRSLAKSYPEQALKLRAAGRGVKDSTDVTVIYYDSSERLICVAQIPGAQTNVVTLYDIPNTPGMLPTVLGARPTADGRIRGQFDHMIAPMLTANRLMDYVAEYADQAVYSPIHKNFPGDYDYGPGALNTIPADGQVGRLAPAQISPEVFRARAELERNARRAALAPESRAGDMQTNGNASYVEATQGARTTDIHILQGVGEVVLSRANELYLAQDRTYCDSRKSILGYAQGRQFKTTYTPSEVIKEGEYGNVVSYGAAAGLDSLNASVRVLQWVGSGLGSKRWGRENLNMPNFLDVERQIEEEFVLDAIKSLTLAQAQQLGNPAPLAAYLKAIKDSGNPLVGIDEILGATQPVPTQAEQQANQAAQGLQQAPAQAQGLAAGAIPSQSLVPLPPLTQISVR